MTPVRYSERMGSSFQDDVFSGALSLPAPERARLVHELIRSLDEGHDADAAEAWIVELERRAKELGGAVSPEEWSAVRARWATRWRKP